MGIEFVPPGLEAVIEDPYRQRHFSRRPAQLIADGEVEDGNLLSLYQRARALIAKDPNLSIQLIEFSNSSLF